MSETVYDVLVVGGGPGGYVAAIRAAQLGLSAACVDKWKNDKGKTVYGGTCLNVGCIPSKALLESSYNYERAAHHFAEHGVRVEKLSLDLAAMQKRKEKVVGALVAGIGGLFKKNKVAALSGRASIVSIGEVCEVAVEDGGAKSSVRAKNLILATGSVPRAIPPAPVDGKNIVDNEGALAFDSVPKNSVSSAPASSVWNSEASGIASARKSAFWRRCPISSAPQTKKSPAKPQKSSKNRGCKSKPAPPFPRQKAAKKAWKCSGKKTAKPKRRFLTSSSSPSDAPRTPKG